MTDNRITEGMGKKIVEALKMQADGLDSPVEVQDYNPSEVDFNEPETNVNRTNYNFGGYNNNIQPQNISYVNPTPINIKIQPSPLVNSSDIEDTTMPTNISILKQLVAKLPVGVTKQTGALIIRQTMEALGTPMKDVLREAQQYQESLSVSTQECQTSIAEHKNQIATLEKQVQQYQKQYAMLNDIISLFVQVN